MFSFLAPLLGSIFGGSSGQSQQQAQSVQQSQSSSQAQQQATSAGSSFGQSTGTAANFNPFTALLSPELLSSLSNPSALSGGFMAQGPYAAPMSAGESNTLANLPTGAGSGTASGNYISQLLGGNFLPGSPGGNPFLEAAITAAQRPTLQGLTETLTQDLPGRFTQAGQFVQPNTNDQGGSSAFDRAAALATRGAAQAMSDIATNMSNNAYNTERQLQQAGVPLAQGEVQTTIANLQAQALPRLIQQMGIQGGIQAFQDSMSKVLDFLKTLSGTAAPVLGNISQSTQAAQQAAQSTGSSSSQSTSSGTSTSTGAAQQQGLNNPFSALFGGGSNSSGFGLGNMIGWLTGK